MGWRRREAGENWQLKVAELWNDRVVG
jgi:hypothetical protein